MLHVRGLNDELEDETALGAIISKCGAFEQAVVRHRILDGQNANWALIKVGDDNDAAAVLAESPITAGSAVLTVEHFDERLADDSQGAMALVKRSMNERYAAEEREEREEREGMAAEREAGEKAAAEKAAACLIELLGELAPARQATRDGDLSCTTPAEQRAERRATSRTTRSTI